MKASLERVASRISGTPLMITERKLDVILNVLAPRIGVEAPQVNMSALGEEATARRYEVHQGVAVVPVVGTLLHRSDWLDAESGLVSYGAIGDMIETAVGDPHVHHIVLDVDSSGGEANGVFDQVDRIYKMRGEKPITAVVNEEANSAAYAVASAADRIVTTRTALSGSIGVIATHVDQSNYNESEGLKVTHVYAGERKADYTPHAPLSDEAQQRLQEQVNETYDIFVETVARNRGMRERAVRDTRAAFFLGRAAVANGLADAVDTVEAVVQRAKQERGNPMSNSTASSTRRGASSGGACPMHAGENLAAELERLIEDQATEYRPRDQVIEEMAEESGLEISTVNSIINAGINCPPRQGIESFAEVLDTTTETLIEAAEQDGCDYSGDDKGEGESSAASSTPAPSAAALPRADAATIVETCTEAGVPQMAAGLIREGLGPEAAKTRALAAGQIRSICAAAGKSDRADRFIKQGASVEQVKAMLFDEQINASGDEITAHVGPGADEPASGDDQGAKSWDDVYQRTQS